MWRLFLLKLTAGTNPSRHVSKIERFYSSGEQIYKFIGTKEFVYIKKEFISHRTGFGNHYGRRFIIKGQQRGVPNNVAVVTSYENAPCSMSFKDINLLSMGLLEV